MWRTAERRFMHIYATCLFKESMFLWKSKLPLYQKLEVPESCSTLHHLIMVASCLQKIELWYPSFGLQVLIVISVVICSDCCKLMKNCRDSAFSNSGLEAGLPASLSADVRNTWRHVFLRNSFPPFLLEFQASTPCQRLQVPENGTLHQLCIIAPCPSLRCSWRKEPVCYNLLIVLPCDYGKLSF